MMRVLMVVGRLASRASTASTPPDSHSAASMPPASSSPTADSSSGLAPRAARLRATLPAPAGGVALAAHTRTTGTGASGEMRPTSPSR